jgi:hypothetical protein
MKLPFPLHFQLHSDIKPSAGRAAPGKVRHSSKRGPATIRLVPSASVYQGPLAARTRPQASEQYAGAYEFSAPDGVAVVPSWMMQVSALATPAHAAGIAPPLQGAAVLPTALPPSSQPLPRRHRICASSQARRCA